MYYQVILNDGDSTNVWTDKPELDIQYVTNMLRSRNIISESEYAVELRPIDLGIVAEHI